MIDDIGYIYILSNPTIFGMVKIGYTKKIDAGLRAAELSAPTGIPLPFRVECSWLVENPAACEARIHAKLEACRVSKGREFFRVTALDAEKLINELLFGTSDSSKIFDHLLVSLCYIYRKYPKSFNHADDLVNQVEAIIRDLASDK